MAVRWAQNLTSTWVAHTSGLSLEVAKQLEVWVESGRATMPLCVERRC